MNDQDAINYQPLEAGQHVYGIVLRRYRIQSIIVLLASIGIGMLIPVVGLGLFVIWVVIILPGRAMALKNGLWQEFAIANGWAINAVSDPLTIIPLSLQFGHSQRTSPAITASLANLPVDLLVYTTVTGEGRYEVAHNFTLARVELPNPLPHILLRAKKDHTQLQQDFANHETLQLEGDFGDYFSLQVEVGQEVNVLEILTPDVMQTLVNYSQNEDIEIEGSDLYFIIPGDARGVDSVRQLTQSVISLSGQIIEQIAQTTAPIAAS